MSATRGHLSTIIIVRRHHCFIITCYHVTISLLRYRIHRRWSADIIVIPRSCSAWRGPSSSTSSASAYLELSPSLTSSSVVDVVLMLSKSSCHQSHWLHPQCRRGYQLHWLLRRLCDIVIVLVDLFVYVSVNMAATVIDRTRAFRKHRHYRLPYLPVARHFQATASVHSVIVVPTITPLMYELFKFTDCF